MSTTIQSPIPQFFGLDGAPLDSGKLYFGTVSGNPETSPITVYWDAALTQPAAQPVRTLNGYTARSGTPAQIYAGSDYSITVKDKRSRQVLYSPDSASFELALASAASGKGASLVGFDWAQIPAAINKSDWGIQTAVSGGLNILRAIAPSLWAGIIAGTYTGDLSASISPFIVDKCNLYFPKGKYYFAAPLSITTNCNFSGDGKLASQLVFTGVGDGVKSTWPINSSTAVRSVIQNLAIVGTNVASTGGGFVDVGGSFIDLYNVYVSGFRYQVIFDQTEVATIDRCELVQASGQTGVWITNGPDHTAGASTGFTNRITISRNQFNCAAGALDNILDDGGVNHTIIDNNFNGGLRMIRAAGVAGIKIQGNECEGHSGNPVFFTTTTNAGAYVGPCNGGCVNGGNSFSDLVVSTHISIDDLVGVDMSNNIFAQAVSANILFNGATNPAVGNTIEGNTKLVTGAFRQAAPFVGYTSSNSFRNNKIRQAAMTYSVAAIAAGSVVVTPASKEAITVGTRLVCVNTDGTNPESVIVTVSTATTFTATFATAKTAGFVIRGVTEQTDEEGTWTPTLAGVTTTGSHTYTTQIGTWIRRGNFVHLKYFLQISAKDAAMAGGLVVNGSPFTAENMSNALGIHNIPEWNGFTFAAGYSQMGGAVSPNTASATLVRSGSAVSATPVNATDIPGTTCFLVGEIVYSTSSI